MASVTAQPDNLLILAAVDLSGPGVWIAESWDRAVGSMALGSAGDILHQRMDDAGLASRAAGRLSAGRLVQRRHTTYREAADGSYTLLAGRLHHATATATRFGIDKWDDHASLYAQLFAKLGDACDRRITGDYAVVQWFPEQRRVRLVRSPTAHAPLHVWRQGDRIVVCSSPNPVFAFGLVPEVDDARVGGWLMAGAGPSSRSFYRGMTCVVCGTAEYHDRKGVRTECYWSIHDVPEVRFRRDEDYVEAVVEQMRCAVDATMGDARAPGVLLSGGFDSQAVAAFAIERMHPDAPLRSYTSIPAPDASPTDRATSFANEEPHVRALCAMYPQIRPTFVDGVNLHFGERLRAMMVVSAWPMFNEMNAHWYHSALEHAAADGVDVIMTGDAGNMGFSYDGLTGFPTWLAQGDWRRLIRELRADTGDKRPVWRKLLSRAVMPHVPQRVKWAIDRGRGWRDPPFESWCALREDHARDTGLLNEVLAEGFDFYDYAFASSRDWRKALLGRMYKGGPEILLGYSLLYGVSIRDVHSYVPLLELCGGIADDQYLRDGQNRWLGRRVLQGRVPEMVWREQREGRQGSDWAMRMSRDRDRLLRELEDLGADPRLARIIDFKRLIASLRDWDGQEVPDRGDAIRLVSAMSRGLVTAQFIRFAEGRNVG